MMSGIQFITDEDGRRTAAVIDLKKHKALFEAFYDALIAESRRDEIGIPFEQVKQTLLAR